MGRRRKRRGHFCWSCGTHRANERFSGKGHARHLCRDGQKLGRDALRVRRADRGIERLLDWGGRIKRKRRCELDRFLQHANPRVRAYAEQVVRNDAEMRGIGPGGKRLPETGRESHELLAEEILLGAHGDDEALTAFCEAFQEILGSPLDGFIAGRPISIREVSYDGNPRRGLYATCVTERREIQSIDLADLEIVDSIEGESCLAAYRSWLGLPASDTAVAH